MTIYKYILVCVTLVLLCVKKILHVAIKYVSKIILQLLKTVLRYIHVNTLNYLINQWKKSSNIIYEPQYDKTNKMSVRPAKTQLSLGIRPV